MNVRLRRAMTLFELVIVLTILAAVTAAVAVATDHILEQRRFEITQRGLDQARQAILGSSEGSIGETSTPLTGFVADVGRLPVAVGSDPATQGSELWSNPAGIEPFGQKQSGFDPDVWLACGWRGPYMRLPVGATGWTDGWGRSFQFWTNDTNAAPIIASSGQAITRITSLGSEGTYGSDVNDPWSRDFNMALYSDSPNDALPITPHWSTNIKVQVWERNAYGDRVAPSGNGILIIRLFGPNPTTGAVGMVESSPLTAPFSVAPQFAFANVTLGPKVIRAYLTDGASVRKSQPTPIEVTRLSVTDWDLVLPPAPAVPATP